MDGHFIGGACFSNPNFSGNSSQRPTFAKDTATSHTGTVLEFVTRKTQPPLGAATSTGFRRAPFAAAITRGATR